ncbi:MAG: Sec-independent protein translocase protein TatB [Pseudomonadota bacterium]|nr:Sec-independent protein translocase protein TatB [Pseudomonadota bacterium]
MFDIAPSEFVLIAAVAILCIGPKDMPRALRTAGRWMGKMRRVSNHFRSGMETMIREAELEEMEQKWREQNQAIMQAHPSGEAVASTLIEHAPPEGIAGADQASSLPALPAGNGHPDEVTPPPAAAPTD